jgi:hypothetical protein
MVKDVRIRQKGKEMNLITMYMLILVAVVATPGQSEEPGIKASNPVVFFDEAACNKVLQEQAGPQLTAWAKAQTEYAVVTHQGACLPVKVPFNGKSA